MIHTELSESQIRESGGFRSMSQLPLCILFMLWVSDSSPRLVQSPKGQISLPGVRRKDRNMKMTMAEGIREMTLNELIRRLGCKDRLGAAPTAKKLREKGEAVIEEKECTVYSNGYAVYSNGTGRTVVFLGDCGSYTYHFNPLTDSERGDQRQSETVDCFGDMPWILAVTVRGEHQIEQNSMNCAGRYSAPADGDMDADENSDGIYRGAYHFPTPQEAYIRKETMDERLEKLTRRQKQLYIMTELYGFTQREAAEKLHIDAAYVCRQISVAKRTISKQ